MNIELTEVELLEAIKYYLGSEYTVESMNVTTLRAIVGGVRANITCTKNFVDLVPTKAAVPSNIVPTLTNTTPIVDDTVTYEEPTDVELTPSEMSSATKEPGSFFAV